MPKLRFLILASTILLAAHASLFAEDAKAPAAEEIKIVTAIEIKGNKAISTNTIASKLKTRIGSPYQENIISDDLKRLYLLNFFSDVKIDSENYKDGLKVIITVVERPIIEKVTFSGIERIVMKEEKLKSQLKSKEGQYLDYPSLAEDIRTLKKMYEKIGYNAVDVNYKLDIDKDTNKVKVNFNVIEGARSHIKNILIEGNKAFSSGRILKLLKTKRGWLFNAGILKEEVLKEDGERIKAFYRRNGYIDVEVSYEVAPNPKKTSLLYVYIKINEGNKYLVGNVGIQGNKEIPEKLIIQRLSLCLPGKVFSDEGMKVDSAAIQGLYFDKGYISARIQDATSLNKETSRVDISYNITENQVTYVDKIKIRGNVKTRDLVIRRQLRIHPGDRFDGEKLRRSKERLQNLGYFEDVSYDTEDAASSDQKDLIVDVKETKTGSFSFGGGYSTVDSLVGFVEVEQKNFDLFNWPYFTGAGQTLKLRASIGNITNGLDLSFLEPWLFDYPVSFGFDVYKRDNQADSESGYGYDQSTLGGDIHFGKEISEYFRADIMYKLEQIEISNMDSDVTSPDLLDQIGTKVTSSLIPSITFDSRDSVFDPRKGNYLGASLEWAGGPLAGDNNFYKFYGRYSHYFPMPRNSSLELRGRIGLAEPYGKSDAIPIGNRFFAGGAYTIRGYKERSVGPVDPTSDDAMGGASMLIGNIEYLYPLFSFLKVAAFVDAGNVWQKIGDLGSSKDANGVKNSGGFKESFGLGLRIKTPIGPVMLDYGFPLEPASGQDTRGNGRFHFSVSNSF